MNTSAVGTDWLKARAEASPNALALLVERRAYTFGELDVLVSRLGRRLAAEGGTPGGHLGLLMNNSLAAVCAVFAAARLGIVLVPLNTRLTPVELAWQIEYAHCTRVLCAPAFAPTTGERPTIVVPTDPTAFESWLSESMPLTPDMGASDAPAPGALDSLQSIVFTSGTTGFPKGAMITFANHFWSAVGSAFKLGTRPDDRWLACLPLFHVGGLAILFRSCLYGTAVILHDGFQEEAVLQSLEQDAPTLVSLVPTMLHRLLDTGLTAATAPSLRLILLGGAAAAPELLARATAAGLPVAVTYGLTEATSQVATSLPEETRLKPGSAGRPLLFSRVAVVDDDGRALPAGEPGENVVSGPTITAGYYGDAQTTAAKWRDGYWSTGDVGYLDGDGDLWVLDRRSDLIVSGGENVYPAEVERVLQAHPAVATVCVVGLPHPEWGQQVAALVVLDERNELTAAELLAHCREHLAGYKQPRQIMFADSLPLTGSGKIERRTVASLLSRQQEAA